LSNKRHHTVSAVEIIVVGQATNNGKEEIQYSNTASVLSFTYKFQHANSYPVTVFVNGKEFVLFYADIE